MSIPVVKIMEHFWVLEGEGARAFLLEGPEQALLIDTGMNKNLKPDVEALTSKPVTLITTHSDGDHIAGDDQFSDHYLHPAEFDAYERRNNRLSHAKPMWEGDIFDIGTFKLEVILAPGHTPGSVVLLERDKRFLIGNDTVQGHTIYMSGDGRNLNAFLFTMRRLETLLAGKLDTVYASHGDLVCSPSVLPELRELIEGVLAGTLQPAEPAPAHFAKGVMTWRLGGVSLYY